MRALTPFTAIAGVILAAAFLFPSPAAGQGSSDFRIDRVMRLPDGTVHLEVRGTPGTAFVIESSSDLEHWAGLVERRFSDVGLPEYVLHICTLDADGVASIVDGEGGGLVAGFYRGRVFP
jgi:hypothetical protein